MCIQGKPLNVKSCACCIVMNVRSEDSICLQRLSSVPAEEREEAERGVKMRTLGNIRLIAELFNKGIVAERIVTACITELIGDLKADPIEDNVEVSCRHIFHMSILQALGNVFYRP